MQEHQNETYLIESIKAGRNELFAALMKPYSRKLFDIAKCELRNHADAEDVLQEVHLKVFTRLGQFRGDARFSSWLHQITVNEIHQYRRRNRARAFVSLSPDNRIGAIADHDAPDALQALRTERTRTAITATVGRLPAGMRSLVSLYHLKELPLSTTAALMGVSEAATKTRLFRARQFMRSSWTARFGADWRP